MTRLTLALVLTLATATLAALPDTHSDYRFAYGTCPTWGTGKWATVRPWIRVRVRWYLSLSNYPISWQATVAEVTPAFTVTPGTCQYVGDPPPMAATTALAPGEFEFVVQGSQSCAPKKVTPKICAGTTMKCHLASDCAAGVACVPGTVAATSAPVAYMFASVDYNGGGESYPSGCIWDGWAYGAPPAP